MVRALWLFSRNGRSRDQGTCRSVERRPRVCGHRRYRDPADRVLYEAAPRAMDFRVDVQWPCAPRTADENHRAVLEQGPPPCRQRVTSEVSARAAWSQTADRGRVAAEQSPIRFTSRDRHEKEFPCALMMRFSDCE